MKSLKHISALLVVAGTLLSSCTLLESSPLHYPRPRPSFAPHGIHKNYNGFFQVPAKGGVYEFECANDQFYISKIYDTSLSREHSNSRYSIAENGFIPVNDLTYDGAFYTITCNKDEHNWIIEVDPLPTSGDSNAREVWVLMWDESDESSLVFQFEQSSPDYVDGIH